MEPTNELEDELRKRLEELYKKVTHQKLKNDAEPFEIEQTTNAFETEWLDRLHVEETAEIRGSKIGVTAAFDQKAQTSDNPSLIEERDKARQVNAATKSAEDQIKNYHADLRHRTVQAILNIEHGREPNIIFQSATQTDKKQEQTPGMDALTRERIREMKADIEQTRENPQTRKPDSPDMDR